jgi:aminoglycoside phosphotransferase (APT) family kinase protein
MNGPDADLRNWVSSQLGSTGAWTSIEGATTAQLWKLEAADQTFVIKAFMNPSFVAEYPDCVEHAAQAMAHVEFHSTLAVPTVVAADPTGSIAGCPVLIMSTAIGEPMVVPTRRSFDRIIDIAEQIHAIPAGGFGWKHRRYNEQNRVFVPSWFVDPGLFAELAARSASAISDEVFIHRDFHPGNLLFSGDQVTGVVDWDYACVGPSGEDYGRTWLNLANDYGEQISRVFASRAARRLDPQWAAGSWLDWLPFYEDADRVEQWGTNVERLRLEEVGRWLTDLA